ncbi:MAG TPA: hypothetical protein PLP28_15390 [Flavobacteriales bacterium]|nr:hypothetical protein [Flavobacteriales bacterium]
MTSLIALSLLGSAFLYWKGWLKINYTGVTKPLCQVSLFGFNFYIKKPDA